MHYACNSKHVGKGLRQHISKLHDNADASIHVQCVRGVCALRGLILLSYSIPVAHEMHYMHKIRGTQHLFYGLGH